MASKGTPIKTYPYKVNAKDLKKSYELRLAAQFGDSRAKGRLQAYNRRIKERDTSQVNRLELPDGLCPRSALRAACPPRENAARKHGCT